VLLLEILNVQNSSLIAQLLAARVIDFREKEELESANCSTHRIQRLLSMLSRKSSSQFEDFLKILDKTGQGHIAKALRGKYTICIFKSICTIIA
jgi:hypothetical protein